MTDPNKELAREILSEHFGIKCGLGGYQRKVEAIAQALHSVRQEATRLENERLLQEQI